MLAVMKIDGRCHCGFVSYEAEVDPERVEICHCTDCQQLSGSAFRVVVPTENFRLLTGEPKTYVKTAQSGNKRVQVFCPQCGTQIYATALGGSPKVFGIRMGTVSQRRELPPRIQYWCRSALPWVEGLSALPKIDEE
jgi:hypothetical protein